MFQRQWSVYTNVQHTQEKTCGEDGKLTEDIKHCNLSDVIVVFNMC